MLSNRTFSARVERGDYPDQVAVPLDPAFRNASGEILNILLERFTSAALITSVAGALRANHWHRSDWHYAFVLSGSVWYYWRPAGTHGVPQRQDFGAGALFFTPPRVEHAMFFPEDTTFLTFAKNLRDHDSHEADLVRVPLVAVARDADATGGWRISFPGVT